MVGQAQFPAHLPSAAAIGASYDRPMSRRAPDRRRSARAPSEDWLYGVHAVGEALRAARRKIARVWIREGREGAEITELVTAAQEAGVLVESVPRAALEARVPPDARTQGVAAEVGPLPEYDLDGLLAETEEHRGAGPPLIVALDGVEDPQNVGAIVRVAEAAGASGLILADRRAPALTGAVARASAGAIEWLPVSRVANLNRALGGLQKAGYWVVAAALEDGVSLYDMDDRLLGGPLVVVLGAEGRGIRPSVAKVADHRVWIPMAGRVASLNVSTAGAVLLFDLLRRRSGREE